MSSDLIQLAQQLLLIVFLTLGSCWFALDLARKLGLGTPSPLPPAKPSPAAESATVSAPAPAPITAASSADGVPTAHQVAIAAVVHTLFHGQGRITSIHPAANPVAAPIDWAREGRRDIFSSHRVR